MWGLLVRCFWVAGLLGRGVADCWVVLIGFGLRSLVGLLLQYGF